MSSMHLLGPEDLATLQRVIASHTYDKNWKFIAEGLEDFVSDSYAIRVIIRYKVQDSYAPSSPRQQRFAVVLEGIPDPFWKGTEEHRWQLFLLLLIVYLQAHEVAEFLLFDGKRVFDPHGEEFERMTQREMPKLWRP